MPISKPLVSPTHKKALLILIIGTTVILRLAVVFLIPVEPTSDFWSYFQRAASLADKGVYEAIPGRPDASYPPLYPLVLSLVFKLPLERLVAAKLLNVLLGTISVILIYLIGHTLKGNTAGLLLAGILAISPRHVLLPILIASENLFTPLLLGWVLVVIRTPQSKMNSFLAGGIAGLLTLTRAIAILLPLPWIIFSLFLKSRTRILASAIFFFLLGLAVMLLPWTLWNTRAIGRPVFLTTTSGINLFIGNNPGATGGWYSWGEDAKEGDPQFADRSVVGQNQSAQRLALEWITRHPDRFAALYLVKLKSMFVNDQFVIDSGITAKNISPPWPPIDPLSENHYLRKHPVSLILFTNTYYWLILILEIAGMMVLIFMDWKTLSTNKKADWMLITVSALSFPLMSAVFLSSTRFRWPMSDLLLPFVSIALIKLSATIHQNIQSKLNIVIKNEDT